MVNTDLVNMKKTSVGRIDGFVCDNINCPILIKENQLENLFEPYRDTPIQARGIYIGFSRQSELAKNYPDFHEKFAKALRKLKKAGVTKKSKENTKLKVKF